MNDKNEEDSKKMKKTERKNEKWKKQDRKNRKKIWGSIKEEWNEKKKVKSKKEVRMKYSERK